MRGAGGTAGMRLEQPVIKAIKAARKLGHPKRPATMVSIAWLRESNMVHPAIHWAGQTKKCPRSSVGAHMARLRRPTAGKCEAYDTCMLRYSRNVIALRASEPSGC